MFAEQVVHLVAAGCGFGEQMLLIELIKVPAGGGQACGVEGSGGVGVEVGAGD